MYLYHFCTIWKLLDIKGRPIILGEPPFLGGDSDLSFLPHYRIPGSQGPLWWELVTQSSFSLLLKSTQYQMAPLFLKMPLDNPKQTITMWNHGKSPKIEPVKYILRLRESRTQHHLVFNNSWYGNLVQLQNYPNIFIFFFCPFFYSL